MKRTMNDKLTYLIKGKRQENYDTVTLSLSCGDGFVPIFVPGQFISIYFSDLNTPEGKSYSISNPPGEETLDVTIKGIGEFSNRLCAMRPGNMILGSLPYGFFFSEQEDTDLIMIAGGIGVTPFRSTILHTMRCSPGRTITLFQSARTAADLVFKKELARLPELSTYYFVTRDLISHGSAEPRRMQTEDILTNCRPEYAEFLICGSIPFVRDLWRGLKEHGVPEDKIYTEAFFSH